MRVENEILLRWFEVAAYEKPLFQLLCGGKECRVGRVSYQAIEHQHEPKDFFQA